MSLNLDKSKSIPALRSSSASKGTSNLLDRCVFYIFVINPMHRRCFHRNGHFRVDEPSFAFSGCIWIDFQNADFYNPVFADIGSCGL